MYDRSDKRLRWTPLEVQYLENKYETTSIEHIAKKLQRSPRSIKHKAQLLNLSTKCGEYLHLRTLSSCFQCDTRVIKRWMNKLDLPYKVVYRNSHPFYLIHPNDIWPWLEQHRDEVDWRHYVRHSILPEPDWVDQCIKDSYLSNHRNKISVHEKAAVVRYKKQGYTNKQISTMINRSPYSVEHIYRKEMKKLV